MLPASLCSHLACILEATARKPGNIHRFQDFEDAGYLDFLLSAAAIAPLMDGARNRGVGQTILEAVHATRRVAPTNTNLGILLLLTPLAAVPAEKPLESGIVEVLDSLTVADAKAVYEAIRLAKPGGLGRASEQDVADEPTQTLRQVMALAAERDSIARQYANGFQEVFHIGLPALFETGNAGAATEHAIIRCHLRLMAACPDTLIARKRGWEEARESGRRAAEVLNKGWPDTEAGRTALQELDRWLRAIGHERNPGTTADLVTASLFVALREGRMQLPMETGGHGDRETGR